MRQIEDAEAYQERVIADAEGEAARFTALLPSISGRPRVTRERFYIDAIEYVYANSSKVLLDAEGSGNLLYLPIDQLMKQAGQSGAVIRARISSGVPVRRSRLLRVPVVPPARTSRITGSTLMRISGSGLLVVGGALLL